MIIKSSDLEGADARAFFWAMNYPSTSLMVMSIIDEKPAYLEVGDFIELSQPQNVLFKVVDTNATFSLVTLESAYISGGAKVMAYHSIRRLVLNIENILANTLVQLTTKGEEDEYTDIE